MKFQIKSDSISKLSADIIILAVNKNNKLCSSLSFSKSFQDSPNLIIKLDDLPKNTGSVNIEHMQGAFKRVCFVRIQNQGSFDEEDLLKSAKNIFKMLKSIKCGVVALPVNQFVNKKINESTVANLFTKAAIDESYEVNSLKSDKKAPKNNYQINFQATS